MPDVSSDLSFSLIHTIYLTFAHNYILFAYLVGLIIAVILALKKPSRTATLLILGFAILAFSFEYDKHIVEGLRQQTLTSLATAQPHFRVQKWVNLILGDIMPILLYIGGWVLIYAAILVKKEKA